MSAKLPYEELREILESTIDFDKSRKLSDFKPLYDPKPTLRDGVWNDFKALRDYYEPILDEFFFNPILSKHPKLKSDVDLFWEKLKHDYRPLELLSRIFSDKVSVSDIKPLIFRDGIKQGYSIRSNLLCRLVQMDPRFINDLQNHLLSSMDSIEDGYQNGAPNPGDLMGYIELLPYYNNKIKERSKIRDCVFLINGSNFTASQNSKLLNILTEAYPKNKGSLQLLKTAFASHLNTQHNFREKFQKYATKINGESLTDKKEAPMTSEDFLAKITILDRVLIDNYKISQNNYQDFTLIFNAIIDDVFDQNFKDSCKVQLCPDAPYAGATTIFVASDSYETHLLAKEQIDKVLTYFDEIASSYINIVGQATHLTESNKLALLKVVDTFTSKITLDKSLSNNIEEQQPSRNKMKV